GAVQHRRLGPQDAGNLAGHPTADYKGEERSGNAEDQRPDAELAPLDDAVLRPKKLSPNRNADQANDDRGRDGGQAAGPNGDPDDRPMFPSFVLGFRHDFPKAALGSGDIGMTDYHGRLGSGNG